MKKKRRGFVGEPAIQRHELAELHAKVKAFCHENRCGPGTEGYSLLCSLGASMGLWPKVKRTKIEEQRKRVVNLIPHKTVTTNHKLTLSAPSSVRTSFSEDDTIESLFPMFPGEETAQPSTVCGIRLSPYETFLFGMAEETGILRVPLDLPLASKLEEAWKRFCENMGVKVIIQEDRL